MVGDGFDTAPALFVERAIKDYVATSADNRIPGEGDEPIFDEPVVGFASGDDPLFEEFKNRDVVGPFHLTPAEALPLYLGRQGRGSEVGPSCRLSVVAAVFPFTRSIRDSNRGESVIGSVKWNQAHDAGAAFTEGCMESVVMLLESRGYTSVAPCTTKPRVEFMWEGLPVSDWSDKHVAYVAGLGTFSLNAGLVTPVGKAIWCCSLITELELPATPRTYEDPMAFCTFSQDGSCGECIDLCPSGAISAEGYDAARCFHYNSQGLRDYLERSGRQGYPSDHVICGLCETMVPCEDRIPGKTGL